MPAADCTIRYIDSVMSFIAVLTSYVSLSLGQYNKFFVRIRIICELCVTHGRLFVHYVRLLDGVNPDKTYANDSAPDAYS